MKLSEGLTQIKGNHNQKRICRTNKTSNLDIIMMPAHFSYFRTIGEIIEEDLKDPGIALGLKESQLSQCVSHSTNSLLWGMDYLEKNIDKHPNYRIKVKQHQFDSIFLFFQRKLIVYDNLKMTKWVIKVF